VARFHVYEDASGDERRYHWRLLDDDGSQLAESTDSFLGPDSCARDAARFRVIAAAATIGVGRHRSGGRVPVARRVLARSH
jgi:hypothetical protein